MNETKQVTFTEAVQLFNEMVMEKYFKGNNIDDMMLTITGNAKNSTLNCAMYGNMCYLEQALYGACMDSKDVEKLIMRVAARISMENLMKKFGSDVVDSASENSEDEDSDD